MQNTSNVYTVEVPMNYRPNLTYFFRNDRQRWQLEFDLPHAEKIRMILTLPKATASKSIKRIAEEKTSDLNKGILTEKEFSKISLLVQGLSIAEGLHKYLGLTALSKGQRSQCSDRNRVPLVFSYFMSANSFKEAKLLIEGSERSLYSGVQHMKEKAIINGCKEIGFKFTHFSQIKEEHIIQYRNFLLMEIEARKNFEKELRSKWLKASDLEKKQLLAEKAKRGMSPMSAKGYFVTLKKVFKALKENKEIDANPASEVQNIKLTEKDMVRSTTPTQDQLSRILKCEYESDKRTDFKIKLFYLFLKETGARKGEALHLERTDIVDGIWKIRRKDNCPTQFGIGWAPKWLKERDVVLSPVALRILDLIPDEPSVGYVAKDPTPYPARFVFTVKDWGENKPRGQRRRTDRIDKTWRSMLKAAGVPYSGIDKVIPHDLRRFKNVQNKHVKNLSLEEMCKELGNSAKVNELNYKGEVDPKIQEIQTQISLLQAKLQEYQGGDELSVLLGLREDSDCQVNCQ